jgi:hypothetical protein
VRFKLLQCAARTRRNSGCWSTEALRQCPPWTLPSGSRTRKSIGHRLPDHPRDGLVCMWRHTLVYSTADPATAAAIGAARSPVAIHKRPPMNTWPAARAASTCGCSQPTLAPLRCQCESFTVCCVSYTFPECAFTKHQCEPVIICCVIHKLLTLRLTACPRSRG